jgi:hypothetical protein
MSISFSESAAEVLKGAANGLTPENLGLTFVALVAGLFGMQVAPGVARFARNAVWPPVEADA